MVSIAQTEPAPTSPLSADAQDRAHATRGAAERWRSNIIAQAMQIEPRISACVADVQHDGAVLVYVVCTRAISQKQIYDHACAHLAPGDIPNVIIRLASLPHARDGSVDTAVLTALAALHRIATPPV